MRSFIFAAALAFGATAVADDWPQWMGPKRDGVWRETGIVETIPEGGPKVVWKAPIGSGYSGPAVVGNRVFVMDYVTKDNIKNENFVRMRLDGQERVVCLNAEDGKIAWTHEYPRKYTISYPSGPRCTPTVHEGRVYALGAEGDLWCLNAEDGKVVWSKSFEKDFQAKAPMWGFTSHPLVDGKKLICVVGGKKDSAVVAFDKDDGKEIWRSLTTKEPGYCPPTMIESGGVRQLLVWLAEGLTALDPETGKSLWTFPLAPRMAMGIMAPQKNGEYLYAGAVWGTAVSLKLDPSKPAVTEAWRGVANMKGKGLYPMNMTPFVEDGVIYGVDQPGQMRAVKIDTGERLWESWLPVTGKEKSKDVYCGTAFIVKNGSRYFIFNEKGELIIATMILKGYNEISRAKLLEPTGVAQGRPVVWSHPAFANGRCYARNDKEMVCVSLTK